MTPLFLALIEPVVQNEELILPLSKTEIAIGICGVLLSIFCSCYISTYIL